MKMFLGLLSDKAHQHLEEIQRKFKHDTIMCREIEEVFILEADSKKPVKQESNEKKGSLLPILT